MAARPFAAERIDDIEVEHRREAERSASRMPCEASGGDKRFTSSEGR